MIDIRYHIYSLAAVFFALAIGIVIGTSFAKKLPGNEDERRTILRYENSMRVLKREIEQASDGAARKDEIARKCQEVCRAMLPSAVRNRLLWRNVAVVQTGDYDDLAASVKTALELAGAQVTSVVDVSRTFPFDDPAKAASVLRSCGLTPPSGKEAISKLFSVIAETLCESRYPYLQVALEESGAAKFARTGQSSRTRLVVLIGGAASKKADTSDTVDATLIEALNRPEITVVGCEGSNASVSYVPVWSKRGIATVDNVDTPMGQLALVCALDGEKARFGVKETADRLVPQTLEAE